MATDVLASITTQTRLKLREATERPWDLTLLIVVVILVGFGIVMLYSASAVMAEQKLGNDLYLVRSQMVKVVLGMCLMFGALRIDYRWYRRLVYPILGASALGLVLVLVPGLGVVQNGAQRWFSIAGFSFQPAEVVKFTVVLYLAYSVAKKGSKMGQFAVGFVPHLVIVGGFVALLMMQPDFGTSVILLTMLGIMLFASGARIFYLFGFLILGCVGAYFAIIGRAYRMRRILAYLDPWSYSSDEGYQISESLIAIGSGGLTGVGLGSGHGKLGYVPELWNDFIGTIVAEELGLVGIVLLVGLFVVFVWRGLRIAFHATDAFGTYLAFGITMVITLQASANLCVVTGLLPNKGLTLPFVSFGGSSMIMCLFAVGVLLNISRNAPDLWDLDRENRDERRTAARWERKRKGVLRRRPELRG